MTTRKTSPVAAEVRALKAPILDALKEEQVPTRRRREAAEALAWLAWRYRIMQPLGKTETVKRDSAFAKLLERELDLLTKLGAVYDEMIPIVREDSEPMPWGLHERDRDSWLNDTISFVDRRVEDVKFLQESNHYRKGRVPTGYSLHSIERTFRFARYPSKGRGGDPHVYRLPNILWTMGETLREADPKLAEAPASRVAEIVLRVLIAVGCHEDHRGTEGHQDLSDIASTLSSINKADTPDEILSIETRPPKRE